MKNFSLVIWCSLFWSLIVTPVQASIIDDLLASMSLEQKVAQMFMVSFYGRPMNDPAKDLIATWQPGAVVLLGSNLGNPEQVTRLTNEIQTTATENGGLPLFIAVDQEGGVIAHLQDGFTRFPVPMLLTATGDSDLAYRVGIALATELRAVGINMNLAPVADLHTNPDNPVIGRRSFGSFPRQVAPIVGDVVRGMQEGGVMATAKHFPGHGDTVEDSHHNLPVLLHDLNVLSRRELTPFMAAFDEQVGATMIAHIWYPHLEPESYLPSTLSYNVTTVLLRQQLRYDGIIMTDAMDMDAIDTVYSPENAAMGAVLAGHDMILMGAHVGPETHARAMQGVVDAVRDGNLPESRIDDSVRRILAAKLRFGLLDWQPLPSETATDRVPLADHANLIGDLFYAGVTVVHDDENLLPVRGDTLVIYPGTQPSLWRACDVREAIRGRAVSVYPTEADITGVRQSLSGTETVVVFTQNADENPEQRALVESLPSDRTIVVAMQSPYDIDVLPDTGAYVVMYSPLTDGYPAVCDILTGTAPARGTLAVQLRTELE